MIAQGTPEWHALRLGKVTASRVADVIARTKSGWGASRANYAAQLIAERLTATVAESYQSAEMRWGTETEPQARAAYEFHAGVDVLPIDFVPHPTIPMAGASPDGLVGEDGLVEIKCPNTATHIETLLTCTIPDRYLVQMQWQMACTGRQWCDFASFDPRMPGHMQLFVRREPRDTQRIAELNALVTEFLADISVKVSALRARYETRTP